MHLFVFAAGVNGSGALTPTVIDLHLFLLYTNLKDVINDRPVFHLSVMFHYTMRINNL